MRVRRTFVMLLDIAAASAAVFAVDPDTVEVGGNVFRLSTVEIKSLMKAAGRKIEGRGAPKKRNQFVEALKALIREPPCAQHVLPLSFVGSGNGSH